MAAFSTEGGAISNFLATSGTPAKLDNLQSFTLCTWVNLQSAPVLYDRLISMHSAGTNGKGFDWFIESPLSGAIGVTQFRLALAVNVSFAVTSADVEAPEGWVFMAVTYDGSLSSDNVRFYMGSPTGNVQQIGVVRSLGVGAAQSTTSALRVAGTERTTLDRTPDAWLDDVRIYGEVLSLEDLDVIRADMQTEPMPDRFRLQFGNTP